MPGEAVVAAECDEVTLRLRAELYHLLVGTRAEGAEGDALRDPKRIVCGASHLQAFGDDASGGIPAVRHRNERGPFDQAGGDAGAVAELAVHGKAGGGGVDGALTVAS